MLKVNVKDKKSLVLCKNFGLKRNNGILSIKQSIEFRSTCDKYIENQMKEWNSQVKLANSKWGQAAVPPLDWTPLQ